MALGPDGRAHAVCMCSSGGEHDTVLRRERPAGGTWGAPQTVADPAEHGGASGERGPLAVTDAAGTLFFAWHGTEFATLQDTIFAGAVPGSPPVPAPSLQSVAHSPAIAAGPAGVVVLAWKNATGVQAAWWTGAAPTEPPPPPPPIDPAAPNHTPAFQGGPARAGRIAGAGLTTPLEPAWTVDTGRACTARCWRADAYSCAGGGEERPVIASTCGQAPSMAPPRRAIRRLRPPRVPDGKLFVAGHEAFALDAATGAELWHSPPRANGPWWTTDGS